MTNFNKIYHDIHKLKNLLRGLSFEQACGRLCGYNEDGNLFDFDFSDFSGTVRNNEGMAELVDSFDIYSQDGKLVYENNTEKQILNKMHFPEDIRNHNLKKVKALKREALKILSPLPQNKLLPCLIYDKILDIVQEMTKINRQMLSTKFGTLTAEETIEEINRI